MQLFIFLTHVLSVQSTLKRAAESRMAKRQTVKVPRLPKRLIGYARVSTEDQVHDAQMDELRAAGCDRIFRTWFWSISRSAGFDRLLGELTAGDVLVVVRLDRLARSVSHLLQVIEGLEGARCSFSIDPGSDRYLDAAGYVFPQVLGAVAQLSER
ncbi:recombinase family protein [Rhizobium beringeri]